MCKWKSEYLQSLKRRQKWNTTRRKLTVGDVVLITDDDVSRSNWSMAILSETYPSKDQLVRKARLQLGTTWIDQSTN